MNDSGNTWLIRGGRIIDPATGRDSVGDLWIAGGRIAPGPGSPSPGARVLDASGLVVVPGLVDLHVHLREPGGEGTETVASGSAAAARGGFTTVVAMPNTRPPVDTPEAVRKQAEIAAKCGLARVLAAGCITSGRSGTRVADLAGMARAGAVAFTDDGSTVTDREVMREAMARASAIGLPVFDHALDPVMAAAGVMREGGASARLNLPGIPADAETAIVRRDVGLARQTGARIHIQHVSAAASIPLLAEAAGAGLPVTAEVTPHHLFFADDDVAAGNGVFKMNPPLATVEDRAALRKAVAAGVFQAFATDHAPHAPRDKMRPMDMAPFGIVGLETAVGATYSVMVESGLMPLSGWLEMWTAGPCRVIGREFRGLAPGAPADVAVLDLSSRWTVAAAGMATLSKVTPFEGRSLAGRAAFTLLGGRLTWNDGSGRLDTRPRI